MFLLIDWCKYELKLYKESIEYEKLKYHDIPDHKKAKHIHVSKFVTFREKCSFLF